LTFNGLFGVISQNIVLFIATGVTTSNPIQQKVFSGRTYFSEFGFESVAKGARGSVVG
jgi:hypothetical protein